MITYVRLENWKTYRTFELRLDRGTTFLVAANGVGKTSFIDAVQWALDRDAISTKAVMRRRAKTTSVVVELVTGDATVRVKRSLTAGRAKTPRQAVEAWVDSAPRNPDDVFRLLADTWKVDNRFASRAAFLTDRFLDKDAEPDSALAPNTVARARPCSGRDHFDRLGAQDCDRAGGHGQERRGIERGQPARGDDR